MDKIIENDGRIDNKRDMAVKFSIFLSSQRRPGFTENKPPIHGRLKAHRCFNLKYLHLMFHQLEDEYELMEVKNKNKEKQKIH